MLLKILTYILASFFKERFFMYMNICLYVCMYVPQVCAVPLEAKRGCYIPQQLEFSWL